MFSALFLLLLCLHAAHSSSVTVTSGPLSATLYSNASLTLQIVPHGTSYSMPPSVTVGGARYALSDSVCGDVTAQKGTDGFGSYTAAVLNCTVANSVPVGVAVLAYGAIGGVDAGSVGALAFEVSLPQGAQGTQVEPFAFGAYSPAQFSEFPSFGDVTTADLWRQALVLCYGGDKAHLFRADGGVAGMKSVDCNSLSGGASILGWPDPAGNTIEAMVTSAANDFMLNYQKVTDSSLIFAALFRNDARDDTVFCSSNQCNSTQVPSGYQVISAEGMVPASASVAEPTVPLYFWWNPTLQKNWVTNSSVSPGPGYGPVHGGDGYLFANSAPGRWAAETFYCSQDPNYIVAASPQGKAYAQSKGCVSQGVLGYVEPPAAVPSTARWSFGLAGNVQSLPPGFAQRQIFVFSKQGLNSAVDLWGTALRRAYMKIKRDVEDIFLQALSLWTDNGSATLGLAWASKDPPPPYPGPGAFNAMNWSAVSADVLGQIAVEASSRSQASVRGQQMDCWWYPVNVSTHPNWCGTDWILPPKFYPNGLADVRRSTGVPLMLYFTSPCVEGGVWKDNYTWADMAQTGYLLPVPEDTLRFFSDLFDYGIRQTSTHQATTWPNAWVPPMVAAGWAGTDLAAYETDFLRSLQMDHPDYRANYTARDSLLTAINAAAALRNLTVQTCAGGVPDMLSALDKPTITQARSTIDYAYDFGDPTNNGQFNWAAADGSWVFWATRVAPSKDNFWSSYQAWSDYGPDAKNGYDCELHALSAILSTSVVGLGDYLDMTNGTLVGRLARWDGILLKPDRPMTPMDAMFGAVLGVKRGLPDYSKCSRLWATHATVAAENATTAPELATQPTRRLVSHQGADDTLHDTVANALAGRWFFLQYLVVAVDVQQSFRVLDSDLYPNPSAVGQQILFYRSVAQRACEDGQDAVASGCVHAVAADGQLMDAAADKLGCGGRCLHAAAAWQVFAAAPGADIVLLGDLSKYVSASGYRFRLDAGGVKNRIVVVGQPQESLNVTWLALRGGTTTWIARVELVSIDSDGRAELELGD